MIDFSNFPLNKTIKLLNPKNSTLFYEILTKVKGKKEFKIEHIQKKAGILAFLLRNKGFSDAALGMELLTEEYLKKDFSQNPEKLIILDILFENNSIDSIKNDLIIGPILQKLARKLKIKKLDTNSNSFMIFTSIKQKKRKNSDSSFPLYEKENFIIKPLNFTEIKKEENKFFNLDKSNNHLFFGAFKHQQNDLENDLNLNLKIPPIESSIFLNKNYTNSVQEMYFLIKNKIFCLIRNKQLQKTVTIPKNTKIEIKKLGKKGFLWENIEYISKTMLFSEKKSIDFHEKNGNSLCLSRKIMINDLLFQKEAINLLLGISNIFGQFTENNIFIPNPNEIVISDGSNSSILILELSKKGLFLLKLQKNIENLQLKIHGQTALSGFISLIDEKISDYKAFLLKNDSLNDLKLKFLKTNSDFSDLENIFLRNELSEIPENDFLLIDWLLKIEKTLFNNKFFNEIVIKIMNNLNEKIFFEVYQTLSKPKFFLQNPKECSNFLKNLMENIKISNENLSILRENDNLLYYICSKTMGNPGFSLGISDLKEKELQILAEFNWKIDSIESISQKNEEIKLFHKKKELKFRLKVLEKQKKDIQKKEKENFNQRKQIKAQKSLQLKEMQEKIQINQIQKKYKKLIETVSDKQMLLENEIRLKKQENSILKEKYGSFLSQKSIPNEFFSIPEPNPENLIEKKMEIETMNEDKNSNISMEIEDNSSDFSIEAPSMNPNISDFPEKPVYQLGKELNIIINLPKSLEICLFNPIELQKEITNKSLLKLVFEKYEFLHIIDYLTGVFFCKQGEIIDDFLINCFKNGNQLDYRAFVDINRIFESKNNVIKEYIPEFILKKTIKNIAILSFSLNEFGYFQFRKAPKLIKDLFSEEIMRKYAIIFSFLIKFRQFGRLITFQWKMGRKESRIFQLLRNKIHNFLIQFQNYLYSYAIEKSLKKFKSDLNEVKNIEELKKLHNGLLDNIFKRSWLANKGKLSEILKNLINLTQEFLGIMSLKNENLDYKDKFFVLIQRFNENNEFFEKVLQNVQDFNLIK